MNNPNFGDSIPPWVLMEIFARGKAIELVSDLPGSICQVGVGRGQGLLFWAKLTDIFNTNSTSQKIIGFDSFTFYPEPEADERNALGDYERSGQNRFEGISLSEVQAAIENYSATAPFSQRKTSRIELVDGLIQDTLPRWSAKGVRFKILEIDVNLRIPTKLALQYLYPLLVPGGLLIFGGFAAGPWEGESEVVAQFLEREGLVAKKFYDFDYPSSVVRKP